MDAQLHRVQPTRDEHGQPVFAVLLKRSYRIDPGGVLTRLEDVPPFLQQDLYWDNGDPTWSTVKHESQLSPYKLATDVVVIGCAHAPQQAPVTEMTATVQVGERSKAVRVIGNRQCVFRAGKEPQFTDPQPFTQMEIRYDLAYGGHDARSIAGLEFHYPRNPMGVGMALRNVMEVIDGLPLPNLEDPSDLLTPQRLVLGEPNRWNGQPMPQGFGWFQKTWYPRCSFVGSMPGFVDVDEVMQEETLRWVPTRQVALARQFKLPAFDVRFNNGASWGLIVSFLRGDEPVLLRGLSADGERRFHLPGELPRMSLDLGPGARELQVRLQTVNIRLEDEQVDLIWRGAQPYPGAEWLPRMTRLHVEVL